MSYYATQPHRYTSEGVYDEVDDVSIEPSPKHVGDSYDRMYEEEVIKLIEEPLVVEELVDRLKCLNSLLR